MSESFGACLEALRPNGGPRHRRHHAVANQHSTPLPTRIKLSEVVELLTSHFECTREHACDLVEREVISKSLQDIETLYPNGMEIETDITTWQEFDWDEGIVMIEPSWSGSPPTRLPVYPLLSLEEVCSRFQIDIDQGKAAAQRRGGRPAQYDWDAFWAEVCRRVHQDGLPETQAEFVDKMLDWFSDRGKEAIDRRTIEKKISKVFAILSTE